MKLTKKALKRIDNPTSRLRLALVLEVSEATSRRYIKNNDDCLTKLVALNLIKEITGLTESEIVEPSNELV